MKNKKIKKPNILITGASSSIGFIVVKQINKYKGVGDVFIGNGNAKFPAQVIGKKIIIIPNTSEEDFLNFIYFFIKKKKINLLIPCSLSEISLLAKNEKEINKLGCRLLVESLENISIFYDKLNTINHLKKKGLPVLETEEIKEENDKSKLPKLLFPFFIKPRFGSGSKGVIVINNTLDFYKWDQIKRDDYKPYIAQEYLDNSLEEYSCSCTFSKDGSIKDIMAIKRKEVIMVTTEAEYNPKCKLIEDNIRKIASKLNGKYILNFQFKVKDNIPFIFEINPRFGTAEAIRIQFGMDAFYSILTEYYDLYFSTLPRKYGTVWRVYNEFFIPS